METNKEAEKAYDLCKLIEMAIDIKSNSVLPNSSKLQILQIILDEINKIPCHRNSKNTCPYPMTYYPNPNDSESLLFAYSTCPYMGKQDNSLSCGLINSLNIISIIRDKIIKEDNQRRQSKGTIKVVK